jgi:hypothetical protein
MLAFTFWNNLTSVGSASVTSGTSSVNGSVVVVGPNATLGLTAKQCAVNLTNVSTGQYITVTLNNLVDALGNSSDVTGPQMGVLIGDVNFNGGVTNGDVALVKAQVGGSVGPSNFQDDVNANSSLSNEDVAITKAQVSTQLSPLP